MNLHCHSCRKDTEHHYVGEQHSPELPEWHGMKFWNCAECRTTRTTRDEEGSE
jgi:hypothetical protein